VTENEARSVYNKIIDSLTVQFNYLPDIGTLIYADVFSRYSISGSVTLGVLSAFSYGNTINYGDFGEDDWWVFGWSWCNSGGYCGESQYSGTHKDDDAAEQIERRIRLNIGVPAQRHYLTDVVDLTLFPWGYIYCSETGTSYNCDFLNPNDTTSQDNYFDYLCFINYYSLPNFHSCLCPDEMNFYLNGEESVATDLIFQCEEIAELISGKDFTSINIEGSTITTFPNYKYVHIMYNVYGIWVLNTNEPNTFD